MPYYLKLMTFQKIMILIAYRKTQKYSIIQKKQILKLFKKIRSLNQVPIKKLIMNLLTKEI